MNQGDISTERKQGTFLLHLDKAKISRLTKSPVWLLIITGIFQRKGAAGLSRDSPASP
jgi:hypothetical protein